MTTFKAPRSGKCGWHYPEGTIVLQLYDTPRWWAHRDDDGNMQICTSFRSGDDTECVQRRISLIRAVQGYSVRYKSRTRTGQLLGLGDIGAETHSVRRTHPIGIPHHDALRSNAGRNGGVGQQVRTARGSRQSESRRSHMARHAWRHGQGWRYAVNADVY